MEDKKITYALIILMAMIASSLAVPITNIYRAHKRTQYTNACAYRYLSRLERIGGWEWCYNTCVSGFGREWCHNRVAPQNEEFKIKHKLIYNGENDL